MLVRHPRLLLVAAMILPCAVPPEVHADILQLTNGDRLHGRLISRESGQIRWESPILGLLTIADAQGTIVGEQAAASPPTQREADTALQSPGGATPPAPAAETQSPTAAARWKTMIESGLVVQTGRSDRADINLRAETSFQRRRNSYLAQLRYLYSKADGSVTTDRTEASFRWRRELDQRWFGQTNTSYLAAKVKGIDHNIEQNASVGYRILKTPRTSASLGAGLTGQYREISDADTGHGLFGEIFQDLAIKLSPRLDLGEELNVQYSPSGRGIRILPSGQVQIIDTDVTNYKFALKTLLRGKITDTLSLSLRYEYEFDNTYVAESEKSDQRITTTLGYTF